MMNKVEEKENNFNNLDNRWKKIKYRQYPQLEIRLKEKTTSFIGQIRK